MTASHTIIEQVQTLVRERYILADVADAIAADLDAAAGVDLPDEPLAADLTRRLQERTGDRHLRVRHQPDGAAASQFGGPEHLARYASQARRQAGGVHAVELLDGGIGVLRIAPSLPPVQFAEPYLHAAFVLLADVEGLVIDLRGGLGGTPETVALICGHLLGPEPVHLQDVEERGAPTRQYWSTPAAVQVVGPVRVLTSARTFSGCEELAYNLQSLSRARVIGETTRGGAHPVEAFALTPTLELHLPVARAVNAVTHTNWEQVGVVPDHPCPVDDALEIARHELTPAG